MRLPLLGSTAVLALLSVAACQREDAAVGDGPACTGAKCDAPSHPWNVNDVSFLYPAPTPAEIELLLGMVEQRDGGEVVLLPRALFDRLGQDTSFLTETPDRDKHYPHLRVTAARIDPCFEQRVPDDGCRRVIRLVAQPAWPVPEDAPEIIDVFDASIHLFYELDEVGFRKLLDGYVALKGGEVIDAPLGVHPLIAREGLGGPFARGLNRLLLAHIGEETLLRMTFMATGRSGNNWFWGGFDRATDGTFALSPIPGLELEGEPLLEDAFDRTASNEPPILFGLEDFDERLLHDVLVDEMSEAELHAAAQQVYRLEDPGARDATDTRCMSCHVAGRRLDIAFARRGLALPPDESYTPPPGQNVEVVDPTSLDEDSMHGLSWFRDQPAVSRRVVKESAEAAALLRSLE